VTSVTRLLRLAGAAAAITAAVAACSSGNGSADSAAPDVATTSAALPTGAPGGGEATGSGGNGGARNGAAASSGTITIQNFSFGAPLTVRPGATIKVVNIDRPAHDVASDDQAGFRLPLLNHGESATFTAPSQPGTYKFSCTVHAQMREIGTLIVQG
jgi:plastocyanin